ncbi:ShlB/FhaC/HecB family hemolysin secretion/activation protein [Chromobacterium alkanivorans]|uniref:ShlB/FhaC/HecB family hemolysin secretion/activation protein n=1 Tax=Chromobacterium alkanivorans TaxID=1071719 RepID=UPI001967BA46|nr:ShlB/FhaC/HecB family hemolysin secretion/activation protein [Chromobacterium alkanivorans]
MNHTLIQAAVLGGFLVPAAGASALDEQILRHQQQQLEQQREELQRRPDVLQSPSPLNPVAAPAVAEPHQGACFEVKRIELEGMPVAWRGWLPAAAARWQGRCLGLVQLDQVVAELSNAMVERGYVTSRVYLPEQNLGQGRLRLAVVPGRIHQIRLKDGPGDRGLASAFPQGAGDILNVRALEQGLEQLGRVPTQQATMEIVPGQQPGESDVAVSRSRARQLTGQLSLDDSGQPATGRLQSNASLLLGGATGFNDLLSLSWSQDAEHIAHPLSQAHTVSWLLPWGDWTAFASYSAFAYRQTVQAVNQSFSSSGHSRNTQLSLARLLHRDQSSKTELKASLTRKASRSFIEDAEIAPQRRDLTIAGLELSHRRYLGEAVLDASLGYQRGIGGWGAQNEAQTAAAGFTARHELFQSRLALQLPLRLGGQTWRWSSELRGQYSADPLLPSEQFSIGSRYTVRGFNSNSLSGRGGLYWRNELSAPLPAPAGAQLEGYLGLDAGRVSHPAYADDTSRSLSGWAAGLRAQLAGKLSAELSHERAMRQPQGWNRPAITHFNLTLLWQ